MGCGSIYPARVVKEIYLLPNNQVKWQTYGYFGILSKKKFYQFPLKKVNVFGKRVDPKSTVMHIKVKNINFKFFIYKNSGLFPNVNYFDFIFAVKNS